jgi:hypothetical protein
MASVGITVTVGRRVSILMVTLGEDTIYLSGVEANHDVQAIG